MRVISGLAHEYCMDAVRLRTSINIRDINGLSKSLYWHIHGYTAGMYVCRFILVLM